MSEAHSRFSASSIKSLLDQGYISMARKELQAQPPPFTLSREQELALQAILEGVRSQNYTEFLLHGVTASGKTEVYLQAIQAVLDRGRTALVLVPEIALTRHLMEQFAKRFPHTAVLHSSMSGMERYESWRRIRNGEASLVLGTRSAVFAPLHNLGLIIIDEEHENTYKQDEWAARSHKLYCAAADKGYLAEEIFALEIPAGKGKPPVIFDKDASPRPDVSVEAMAKLPTIYGSPTVTPGNAPGLSTGAAGLVVTTRKKAAELGLEPMATVLKVVSHAIDPRLIAVVPAPTIQKALKIVDLTLDDMKTIEINEAFAAMPLVSTKILGEGDEVTIEKLRNKTNIDGGAIALGHPVGASGLRITMHLMNILRRQGGGYGVAAICGGLAQGDAVILKVD
jgi:hypothetical protein